MASSAPAETRTRLPVRPLGLWQDHRPLWWQEAESCLGPRVGWLTPVPGSPALAFPHESLLSTLTAPLLGPELPGDYTPAVAWPLAGSHFNILCDALRQAESRKRNKGRETIQNHPQNSWPRTLGQRTVFIQTSGHGFCCSQRRLESAEQWEGPILCSKTLLCWRPAEETEQNTTGLPKSL